MINALISRKALETEMTVVRNEFERKETNPGEILENRVSGVAFKWHNYANDTLGARSDIENIPIDRLQAFYQRYYQPDNAVLLIAGKFQPDKTLNLISEAFGKIPRPSRVLSPLYTVEPAQDGEQTVTVRRIGGDRMAMIAYHVPAAAHPDKAAVDVLVQVLLGGPEKRLFKDLVESKKAAMVIGWTTIRRDPDLAFFRLHMHPEDSTEDGPATLIKTVEEFSKQPPESEEIERARRTLLQTYELNSPDRVAVNMSEWIGAGDWRLFFINRDRIKKVSAADIQRVAAAYFRKSNRTLGLFIPSDRVDRVDIPVTPDIAAIVKDYKGEEAVSEGEAFDPTPVNIEQRVIRKRLPVGMKLAMMPKRTRGNTVNGTIVLRFGDEKSLAGRSTSAMFAAIMMMQSTAKHTRQQLFDSILKLKSSVMILPSSTGAVEATIESTRENLPATLAIVSEMLREPAFPAPEFEQFKKMMEAAYQGQLNQPQMVGHGIYTKHLNPYPKDDVRYTPTMGETLELIKSVTLDDVKHLHAQFISAANSQAVFVGDFDPAEVEKALSDLFGSWKSGQPYSRVTRMYKDVPPINRSLETPDKPNAYLVAGMNLRISDDDPDYPALVLANYIIGGGFLNSRLSTRIRQKEGLSYEVGSSFWAYTVDKAGGFQMSATVAPQNVTKVETALKEEIEKVIKDGFTKEEVETATAGLLQSYQVTRSKDSSLAGTLSKLLFWDRTLAWQNDLEKKIAALTPSQLTAAIRKHIDPTKITIVKAGDFAKAQSK
jgi:zinc protease